MKRFLGILLALLVMATAVDARESRRAKRKAREKAKMEEVRGLYESSNLRFVAQMAQPMGGGSIHLTPDYTLDIEGDRVTAFLPYFGVAYTADYGGDGGIQFSETVRAIGRDTGKKGYAVRLEVKAPKDLYRMHLTFSPLGYGSLDVSCHNRQPIRFTGIVTRRPVPEEIR